MNRAPMHQPTKRFQEYQENFRSIEGYFAHILSKDGKGDMTQALRGISRNIQSIFQIQANIQIAKDSASKSEFFGMQVYPLEHRIFAVAEYSAKGGKDIRKIVDLLELKEVVIEIDEKILNRFMQATPQELVAVLLHEIGHVCYDNSYIRRYLNAMTLQRENMSLRFRTLTQWNESIFSQLFSIPLLEAITSKNWQTDVMGSEIQADRLAVEYGYGEFLQSILGKIIKTTGTGKVNRRKQDMIQDIMAMFQWIIEHLNSRYIRQASLQAAINGEIIRNPSPYARAILEKQLPKHDAKQVEPYELAQYESTINLIADRYTVEGMFSIFDKNKKVKEVKQSDIDYIRLEVDKMRDHDDRIFVLDLIYDQLDIIEASEDLLASGKIDLVRMNKTKLDRAKQELMELRKEVLLKKLGNEEANILIRYPKGYEG